MASPPPPCVRGAGMRLLRAAVFTAVCVVLAAAGHTLGLRPYRCRCGRWWPAGSRSSRSRRRWPGGNGRCRASPQLLAVGQLALHTVFGLGSDGARGGRRRLGPRTDGTGDGLMAVAARLVCEGHGRPLTAQRRTSGGGRRRPRPVRAWRRRHGRGRSARPAWPAAMPGGGARTAMAPLSLCSLPMLLGHLLAAVVAGWLLRRGEAALWRLVRLSVRGAAGAGGAVARRAAPGARAAVGARRAGRRRRSGTAARRAARAPRRTCGCATVPARSPVAAAARGVPGAVPPMVGARGLTGDGRARPAYVPARCHAPRRRSRGTRGRRGRRSRARPSHPRRARVPPSLANHRGVSLP